MSLNQPVVKTECGNISGVGACSLVMTYVLNTGKHRSHNTRCTLHANQAMDKPVVI